MSEQGSEPNFDFSFLRSYSKALEYYEIIRGGHNGSREIIEKQLFRRVLGAVFEKVGAEGPVPVSQETACGMA